MLVTTRLPPASTAVGPYHFQHQAAGPNHRRRISTPVRAPGSRATVKRCRAERHAKLVLGDWQPVSNAQQQRIQNDERGLYGAARNSLRDAGLSRAPGGRRAPRVSVRRWRDRARRETLGRSAAHDQRRPVIRARVRSLARRRFAPPGCRLSPPSRRERPAVCFSIPCQGRRP